MLKREEAIENIIEVIEYLENTGGIGRKISEALIYKLKEVLKFLES